MKQIIEERCELIVHQKRNLFYLTKRFQKKLQYDIDIFISDENAGELLVREKEGGNIRPFHYSKKMVEELVNITNDEGKMHFVFFRDEEKKLWRGILLPELRDSRIWKEINSGIIKEIHTDDMEVLLFLKNKYKYVVDDGIINECVCLGRLITEKVYPYMEKWKRECILLCAWSLAAEEAKIQRRCQRAELPYSMDRAIGITNGCTYKDMWGLEDVRFVNIEIEEFKSKLTCVEKLLLQYLEKLEEWRDKEEYEILAGSSFWSDICGLQKKAIEYYGKEYVWSRLAVGGNYII